MPLPANPAALFHLRPLNDVAHQALHHPDNRRFVSTSELGDLGLEVGFHVASVPGRVMARLGRDADLILPQPNVSAVHVSLEIHPDTLVVLLSTRTKRASSVTVQLDTETPVKPGGASPPAPAPSSAEAVEGDCVLSYGVKYFITIARHRFHLIWREGEAPFLRELVIQKYKEAMQRQAQGNVRSPFLPTEPDSEAHTWHNTRIHTAQPPPVKETSSAPRVWIGGGQFGAVYRVAEDLNGHAFAVKVIDLKKYPDPEQARALAHREIKALERLKHKHIIECLGHAKWDTDEPEVFMPLRMGNLTKLTKDPARNKEELPVERLCGVVLEQVLSALDYLDWHSMCHRDVKPDNIVYYWLLGEKREKVYTFQLADFGLANYRQHAATVCGTGYYMAPEIQYGTSPQSPKMDVWSLFATIAEIHPRLSFPPSQAVSYVRDIVPAIRAAALEAPEIAAMAREDPKYRASAAQMLVALFDSRGLTTPKGKVLPMPELPVVVLPRAPMPSAPVRAPARPPPAFPLVKYPPRTPRKLLPPRDAGNAALRPRGDAGITKPRARKPSAAWGNFLTAPKSPAGLSRPLQPQPQPRAVPSLGKGGPQPTRPAAAATLDSAAQMPDLVPLSLGPSPTHNPPPQPPKPRLPCERVKEKEPIAVAPPPAAAAGLESPVAGRDPKRRDDSGLPPGPQDGRWWESPQVGKLSTPQKKPGDHRVGNQIGPQRCAMPGAFPD